MTFAHPWTIDTTSKNEPSVLEMRKKRTPRERLSRTNEDININADVITDEFTRVQCYEHQCYLCSSSPKDVTV